MLPVLSMRYDVLLSLATRSGVTNPDILRAMRWMRDAYLNAYLYFPSAEGVLLADGTVENHPLANSVKTYTTVRVATRWAKWPKVGSLNGPFKVGYVKKGPFQVGYS